MPPLLPRAVASPAGLLLLLNTPPRLPQLMPLRACVVGASIAPVRTLQRQLALGTQRKVTVYTRTGDKGTSSLYNGTRREKDDLIFHALGSSDSLNAHIGVARQHLLAAHDCPPAKRLLDQLRLVQCTLIDLGASIATPPGSSTAEALARVQFDGAAHTSRLEGWIDEHELALPPLRTFVLPGGGLAAANLHVARTACRETERVIVELSSSLGGAGAAEAEGVPTVDPSVLSFVNRLSDFLFVATRVSAALPTPHGGTEEPYAPCKLG